MSKILGIITAVVLVASAFIAFKNDGAKTAALENLEQQQQREIATQDELAEQKARITDAEALVERYKLESEETEEAIEVAIENHKKAKSQIVDLEDTYNSNESKITSANSMLSELPDASELVPQVKRMNAELAELSSGIASEESRLANLVQQDQSSKKQIAATRELVSLQSSGESYPTLRTSIAGVYPDLGFVVLAAGDSQGVVTGSTLRVIRGGEELAKLTVTAVEAGRSSASVVLGSLTLGEFLRPGDIVVPAKSEG
ncbi:MAG: hypothetical protein ACSHX0_08365 [Akkermansiaceae bacterium]